MKRLSQWHRYRGGELTWLYVWEAVGGPHVHALVNVPRGLETEILRALNDAFAGHDVTLEARRLGPGLMASITRGTDWATHRRIRGSSHIYNKKQGEIHWRRCGVTENINKSARDKAGFDTRIPRINCAKTYSERSNSHQKLRSSADDDGRPDQSQLTYIVL